MKHPFKAFLFILLVFSFANCQKFKQTIEGKGKVEGQISLLTDNSPLSDIMMVLIDKDIAIDHINYDNAKIFLDTVATDSEGHYQFNLLDAGNYAVVPISSNFKFHNSNEIEFEVKKEETFIIDFSAEIVVSSGHRVVDMKIKIINIPTDIINRLSVIKIYRRRWMFFIPYLTWEQNLLNETESANTVVISHIATKGLTFIWETIDNYFKLVLMEGSDLDTVIPSNEIILYTPLGSTPDKIYWSYDWERDLLERVDAF